MDEKGKLRIQFRKHRNKLTKTEQDADASLLCDQLFQLMHDRIDFPIHLYLAMGGEISLAPVIEKLLTLGIPVVSSRSLPGRQLENFIYDPSKPLKHGLYGTLYQDESVIYEGPYSYMIIPGLAFDRNGVRLGYGAGYYDRFLARYPQAVKIGVAYDFQYVDSLPREDHDICMDVIVTPSQIIKVCDRREYQ